MSCPPSFDSVLTAGNDTSRINPFNNAVDAAGNTYMTGQITGVMDLDPSVERPDGSDILTPRGYGDAFIAKSFAPDNSFCLGARRMGSDDTNINNELAEEGTGVAVDAAGNVFVTGSFKGRADFGPFTLTSAGDSDVFVTKLAPNGSVLWAKSWGGSTRDQGSDIAIDGGGNVISVGTTLRVVNSSGGVNFTGFEVRKFSPTGAAVWSKRIDNSGGTAVSVGTDASGNIFVGGQFYGTTDFNPDPKKTSNVTGANQMVVNGGANAYVLKLKGSGEFGWVAPFVAKTSEASNSWGFIDDLAVDGGGNVVVGGNVSGQVDLNPSSSVDYRLPTPNLTNGFVARLTPGGSLAWARRTGGACVNSLAVDPSGAVYATGTFMSATFAPGYGLPPVTSKGGPDVYVTKFTVSGALDWALTFGGLGTTSALESPWTVRARSTCRGGTWA